MVTGLYNFNDQTGKPSGHFLSFLYVRHLPAYRMSEIFFRQGFWHPDRPLSVFVPPLLFLAYDPPDLFALQEQV